MANEPSVSEVETIIDTDLTDAQVTAFIDAAGLYVDEKLGDTDLSSGLLTEITKWLAAHLLSTRDKRVAEEAINDVDITYQGNWGKGLEGTTYGQNAIALDPTGTLKSAGKAAEWSISSW